MFVPIIDRNVLAKIVEAALSVSTERGAIDAKTVVEKVFVNAVKFCIIAKNVEEEVSVSMESTAMYAKTVVGMAFVSTADQGAIVESVPNL